jgi:lipopolysaccharide export system permease protein
MSNLRINRYLLREITIPMGLALAIFTFVLLMGRILKLVELVINKGVPPTDIAKLFLCLMPSFLIVTLPLSFLLGVMLGFGRLSADREVMACKASGISLYQMAVPVLLLGLLTSLGNAALTLVIRPASETAFREQLFKVSASRASIAIQPNVFNDSFDGLVIYAGGVDDRSGVMHDVFISDEREESLPAAIIADTGRIVPNRDTLSMVLRLENGAVHRQPEDKSPDSYQVLQFSTYDINLGLDRTATKQVRKVKKPKEMSLAELRTSHDEADAEKIREIRAELQGRFSRPLAPLLFALIAIPFGIQPHRSGRGGAFALGLFTFLCYFLLCSFAETLAVEGQMPAAVLWLPNLLFLAGGLFLFRRSATERPVTLPSRAAEALFHVLRRIMHRGKRP